jgi:nucleoside phosphorylase
MSEVDILFITALPEELEVIKKHLPTDNTTHSQHCALTYHLGSLEISQGISYLYALTCLYEMGNSDSSVSSVHAIRDLNPNYVFMFGIAAAVNGRADLADVIVATKVFYYELAKAFSDRVEIRPQSFQTDSFLTKKLKDFCGTYTHRKLVKFGPFAVGEKVVANSQMVQDLKKYEPKLLGIEMESYGVANAIANSTNRPRFITIRGVSDFANEQKDDDWRELALQNASEFTLAFLRSGILLKEEKLPPFKFEIKKKLLAIHHLSINKRGSILSPLNSNSSKYIGYEIEEILIDQTSLFSDGQLLQPTVALNRQNEVVKKLNHARKQYPQATFAYFGLAHIPLMFHLGAQINREFVDQFVTNRASSEWYALNDGYDFPELSLSEDSISNSGFSQEVVIRASISYPVTIAHAMSVVENPQASYHLSLHDPKPDVVISNNQVNDYATRFHSLLVHIKKRFPDAEYIHLLLSVSPPVAFRFAQQISKTIDPDIIVWNYSRKDHPNYGWGINIMSGKVIDRRTII